MKKRKIVICTNVPSPYRVKFFNYLINSYEKYDIKIVYSAHDENDRGWNLNKDEIKNSINLKSKTLRFKGKLDNKYIHIPFNIINILNKKDPDVVIGAEYNLTCVFTYLWCKFKKRKFISWSDGTLYTERNINFIQRSIRRVFCKNACALIASSSRTREAQIKYGANKEKIFLSYLTVDIDEYLNKKRIYNNRNILYVGNLSVRKGVDLLIKSLINVKEEFTLNIVGEGPEKENLIKLCEELNIKNKVNFLGKKNGQSLLEIYKKSDILVIPSREDCFGLVITEAMCNCIPVISSKYAEGSVDLIKDNENGYIVDPNDSTEFANKITYLLKHKEKIKDMGEKSYDYIKHFSFKEVAPKYIQSIEYSLK